MITVKRFRNIEQLQKIQYLANQSGQEVGIHSEDGSVIVDAKSFIGMFALDFSKPVKVVCEDINFHKNIKEVGETLDFLPEFLKSEVYG